MNLISKLEQNYPARISEYKLEKWVQSVSQEGYLSPHYLPLVACHRKLLLSICHKWTLEESLPVEDAFQECLIHFVEVCKTYNPSKGSCFRTHLAFHARDCVQRVTQEQGGCMKYKIRTRIPVEPIASRSEDLSTPQECTYWDELDLEPIDWKEMLESLPDSLRRVAIFLFQEGKTKTEVAGLEKTSRRSIYRREKKILQSVKKIILI